MTDTGTTTPPPTSVSVARKAPRWMWALLIVSLAINLLVVGVVAGAGFARPFGGPGSAALGFGLVRYGMAQGGEARDETRQVLARERPRIDPIRRELRAARLDVAATLEADPFDRSAFKAAQVRVIELERRLGTEALDALSDIAGRLTAEQRREFVRQHRRFRGHHGREGGEGHEGERGRR